MKVKNVTSQEIEAALKTVNKKYENNIVFKRFEQKGKQFVFTLTVKRLEVESEIRASALLLPVGMFMEIFSMLCLK